MLTSRAYRAVDVQRCMDSTLRVLRHADSPAQRSRWADQAHRVRDLAALLRVDPGLIATIDYLDFTEPQAPADTVALMVMEPRDPLGFVFSPDDAAVFTFAPHPGGGFWWLWPCPDCVHLARLCRVTDLADIGAFLHGHPGLPGSGSSPVRADPGTDDVDDADVRPFRYCAFHGVGPTPPQDLAPVSPRARPRLATDALRAFAARGHATTEIVPAGTGSSGSPDQQVRSLAATLGVDPDLVVPCHDAHRSAHGPEGRHQQPLLTVRQSGDPITYTFIADTDSLYSLIWPCPRCASPVPMCRIGRPADLGYFLESRTGLGPGWDGPEQFYGDPGHTLDCGYRAPRLIPAHMADMERDRR